MKKKNLFRRAAALTMAGVMTMSLTACGGGGDESASSDTGTSSNTGDTAAGTSSNTDADAAAAPVEMEDTTINIRVMNEFKNLDKVIAKYTEMTKDDPVISKIHLDFQWVAGGDYKDKLTMSLAAQEDFDLMFCGAWHGLNTFAQEGNFADLSFYFNNDNYPGLKAAFSENFVDAMTSYIRQEDGSYKKGIYGINLASFYEDSRGFMYREDLRQRVESVLYGYACLFRQA